MSSICLKCSSYYLLCWSPPLDSISSFKMVQTFHTICQESSSSLKRHRRRPTSPSHSLACSSVVYCRASLGWICTSIYSLDIIFKHCCLKVWFDVGHLWGSLFQPSLWLRPKRRAPMCSMISRCERNVDVMIFHFSLHSNSLLTISLLYESSFHLTFLNGKALQISNYAIKV